MGDAWGSADPDEIELIEPDATAFGGSGAWSHSEMGEPGDTPTRTISRGWLVGAGTVAALAGLVAALLVWAPWKGDDTLSFDGGGREAPTLSDRLVIADAPGELRYRDNTDNSFFGDRDPEGYFFAEPGARMPLGRGDGGETGADGDADTGRWVAVLAIPDDGDSDPEVTDDALPVTVQGSPGTIERSGPLTVVDFGPLDGKIYSVGSVGLTDDEVLRFADAVRIDGDVTVLDDRSVIDDMEPLGPFGDYRRVLDLLYAVSDLPWAPGPAVCYQAAERWCISSDVASDQVLALIEFVFGISGTAEVHGEPALVGITGLDEFNDELAVVAWREGGRLVVVAGTGTVDDATELAESVREAADDEWLDVLGSADDGLSG